MPPDMPRHPRSSESFSSLELASIFAQLRLAIGVSLDFQSFYVVQVWLRFCFSSSALGRVSRFKSGLPRSAEHPFDIIPTFGEC
jgi:hypothetical protein